LLAVGASALLVMTGGCFVGMFFPTSIDTEFANPTPLRGPVADVRTVAVVLPSALESVLGAPDSSRGKLDMVGLDLAERLQDSGRFSVVPPDRYRTALAAGTQSSAYRVGASMTEADRSSAILKAARTVNADGVILLQGQWEMVQSIGSVSFGRPEYRRQMSLTLIGTKSGETLWSQEATAVIHEGIAMPQEPDVREALVSSLAKHFLKTTK
jgi:hypothetical protein